MSDFALTALVFFVLGFNIANVIWQLGMRWAKQ